MAVFISYCPQFRGSRRICMPRKNLYMLERYDPKLADFAFYGCFHELLPTVFGFHGGFACLVRTFTCWRDMTRNSSFSHFLAVFMSYCPQFWGYKAIYNDLKTRYMFESYDQKLVVFVFMAIFMRLARPVRPVTCLRFMTKKY